TGLGLSIVYGIVNQSSGTIRVDSQLGRGTSFEILLPRVFVNDPPLMAPDSIETITPLSETILLVEDEDALRTLVREVLRSAGYTVLEAGSGEEAMSVIDKFPGTVALLVTDMIMPGISGLVLADRLRDSRPELKVLYISGYTENLLDGHGPLNADTAFLQKPFAPAALTRMVGQLLGKG